MVCTFSIPFILILIVGNADKLSKNIICHNINKLKTQNRLDTNVGTLKFKYQKNVVNNLKNTNYRKNSFETNTKFIKDCNEKLKENTTYNLKGSKTTESNEFIKGKLTLRTYKKRIDDIENHHDGHSNVKEKHRPKEHKESKPKVKAL